MKKLYKRVSNSKTTCGFKNKFFMILKHQIKNDYSYCFYDFFLKKYRIYHRGNKKSITGISLTSYCIVYNVSQLVLYPFWLVVLYLIKYLIGLKNLLYIDNDSSFFNKINFILVLVLLLILIFR